MAARRLRDLRGGAGWNLLLAHIYCIKTATLTLRRSRAKVNLGLGGTITILH